MNYKPDPVLERAAGVYADAMFGDPLHVWFFPSEKTRKAKLRAMYRLFVTAEAANLRTSPDGNGYALWQGPLKTGPAKPGLLALLFLALGFLAKVEVAELFRLVRYALFSASLRRRLMPKGSFYLAVIAVSPSAQGRGVASGLIRPVLVDADMQGSSCFLETENPDNLPKYERLGFRVEKISELPGAPFRHWCLIRRPSGN